MLMSCSRSASEKGNAIAITPYVPRTLIDIVDQISGFVQRGIGCLDNFDGKCRIRRDIMINSGKTSICLAGQVNNCERDGRQAGQVCAEPQLLEQIFFHILLPEM